MAQSYQRVNNHHHNNNNNNNNNNNIQLFGIFPISKYSDKIIFIICVLGVFFCYFIYGIAQENIFNIWKREGTPCGWALTFLQYSFYGGSFEHFWVKSPSCTCFQW